MTYYPPPPNLGTSLPPLPAHTWQNPQPLLPIAPSWSLATSQFQLWPKKISFWVKIRLLKRWNSGLPRPFLIFLVPSPTWEHLHHHHHPNHRHHHPDHQDLDQDQEWCPASAPYQHSAASASTCYRSPVSGALHGDDNDEWWCWWWWWWERGLVIHMQMLIIMMRASGTDKYLISVRWHSYLSLWLPQVL